MDLSLRSIRRGVTAFSIFALIASMFVTINVANAAYGDVPADAWYAADVQWGLDNGILDPTQAYFRGGDNATRAEFSKMVAAAAGIPEAACDETLFPDVNASHWGCGWITALADAGVVSGDTSGPTAGYFRPNDNLVRAEAAKMAVEAFALTAPAGTLGSDYFTDSVVGQWYDEYIGVARYNCVFQGVGGGTTVEPGRNIVRAEAIAVVNRADTPTTDCSAVVAEGALTVALDGSSPDSAYIPQNAANVLYSVFAFTASAEEDINVEELIISRSGLGLPGDFDNLKVYVDGVQKGGEKTLNVSTNSSTFSLASDPINVPAGMTVLVEVRADMQAAQNSQNALCIDMPEDVLAMGDASNAEVTVGGSFAVCGEYMMTTSATVGTLTYTVSQPSAADINIGDTDVSVTKVKMDMATEGVDVNRITFKQAGSANPEDFGNPMLYVSGSPIDANYSWEGDYLTFDLSDSPLNIAKGSSKTVELRVDVVGGLNTTAAFDIYRDWHIEGTGTVYGYGVNVAEAGASISPANRDIIGGNIAFSLSANNPVTGDVKVGAEDFEFTRFNISTSGDGVTVRKISLTVNGVTTSGTLDEIEDVKIWAKNSAGTWVVVAGPNDLTGALVPPQTVAFTDTFDVPAAATTEFIVTADLTNTAVALDTYSIDVADVTDPNLTELEFSDGDPVNEATEVTGGTLTGNVMTVMDPSFVLSLAATPGDKTYVKNTTDRDLVAFDVAASTADDLRVTGMTITCQGAPASLCSDAFQSLNLYKKDGSTITKLAGPKSMTALAGGDGNVVFGLNETILAGDSSRFLLRGNIASAAVAAAYGFEVSLAGDVTVEDTESAAATDNTLAYPVGTRVVTVAGAGTLANTGISDADTKARLLVGLSADEAVLKVRFAANELEGWIVKKLTIDELVDPCGVAPCTDSDVTKVYVSYVDKDGATQKASATLSGGTLTFNNLAAYVPAGGNQTLLVTVDVADVSTGNAVAGDVFQMFLNAAAATYEAVGESSGTQVLAGTDVTGEMMRVAKSAPTVAKVDLSTTLANGELSLYKMTVAADAAGDIAVKQLGFNLGYTFTGLGDATDFKLFKNGVLVSDTANVDILSDNGTNMEPLAAYSLIGDAPAQFFVQFDSGATGGEDIITKGTSATYELKATFAGIATGDSVTTAFASDTVGNVGVIVAGTPITVGGGASNFVWSDMSAALHDAILGGPSSADWLDGWLVNGVSSAGSQVLSK